MPYDKPLGTLTSFRIREGRPQIDFDHYLPFGLTALANKIARSASRIYLDRFGIGINEWRILGTTANAICQRSALDKAAVSRSLKLLEDSGMVEASEGGDGRGRGLRLTQKGDGLHDQLMDVALEREAKLLSGFSDAERRLLLSLVERLHANLPLLQSSEGG
jgi:DNA-binding MarR family transcriptional regulator